MDVGRGIGEDGWVRGIRARRGVREVGGGVKDLEMGIRRGGKGAWSVWLGTGDHEGKGEGKSVGKTRKGLGSCFVHG